jgi:hypothetical protein
MVQEFINVLVDASGTDRFGSIAFDPEVEAALGDVDIAMDYALRGLQAYAVTFSLWPLMTRAYEQLAEVTEAAVDDGAAGFGPLQERMKAHLGNLKQTPYLATEAWRADREKVYADMYARCGAGVSSRQAVGRLQDLIAPCGSAELSALEARLRDVLKRRLACSARHDRHVEALAHLVWTFVAQTQSILREASATQAHINSLLGRQPPVRPFTAADMDIHNLLQGSESRRLPFLLDELAAALGIHFEIDRHRIELTDRRAASPSLG